MRVAILGSGLMGGKLGTIFARAGHEVVFSYARSRTKLERLARAAGGKARAGTPAEAVREAEAVLLAVNWPQIDDVLDEAGDLSGKVIVTCSLPMDAGNAGLVIAHSSSGAEDLAKKVRSEKVVSAFNTVPSEVLFAAFDARRESTRPSLVYCGDDQQANGVAAELIRDAGFDPANCGPLRMARYTEPFALLVGHLAYATGKMGRNWHTDSSDSADNAEHTNAQEHTHVQLKSLRGCECDVATCGYNDRTARSNGTRRRD